MSHRPVQIVLNERMRPFVNHLAEPRGLFASARARQIREAARVSAKDCADEVGVSDRTYSGWEAGRSKPRSRFAVRALRLLRDLEALQ